MTKQNLFQKLYKDGKNILQSGALKNAQAKMSSKINGSIVLAHEEVDNSTSKIRDMLCSIKEGKFEHTEYVKLKMEINKQKEIIKELQDLHAKLFGTQLDVAEYDDIWENIDNVKEEKSSEENK